MAIQSIIRRPTSLAGSQLFGWTTSNATLLVDGTCSKSQQTAQNLNVPYLRFSHFDNPVPSGATVTGIAVRITAKAQYNGAAGFHCAPVSSLNPTGSLRLFGLTGVGGRGTTAFNKATLETKVMGGDSDLWGAPSIDVAELNAPAFEVYTLFRNGNTTPQSMFIDGLEVEVFYDDGVPDPFTGGGSLPPKNP